MPNAHARLGAQTPTIGVLTDCLEDGYHGAVLNGIAAIAREREMNVLCVVGGALAPDDRELAAHNRIFERIGAACVDGVVVLAGALGNRVGPDGVRAMLRSCAGLPTVSIAMALEGASGVLVDDEAGLRASLGHLVHVHGHRRVAFIRGPVSNPEAERRYATYASVLAEAGIALDDALVAPGDFQRASGSRAVALLLDERGLAIDAIAAANDQMAFGAIGALQARGFEVGRSVAVVGFDDAPDARHTEPPLTTVRQPLDEQGRRAARQLFAELRSGAERETYTLRAELVVRASCGCSAGIGARDTTPAAPVRFGFDASIVERRAAILGAMTRAAAGAFAGAGSGWELRMLTALADDLRADTPKSFVPTTLEVLRRAMAGGCDTTICHEVLTVFRRVVLPCLAHEPIKRAVAEDLLDHVRVAFSQGLERAMARDRLRAEHWARTMGRACASVVGARSREALRGELAEWLPRLGISSLVLVVDDPREGDAVATSRLVLGWDAKHPEPAAETASFASAQLLPSTLRPSKRGALYVLFPLVTFDALRGHALIELAPATGFGFSGETLRRVVTAAAVSAGLIAG
jgi:sigma-B regulation protein RsbU (phosphoserine phosphatase)